MSDALVSLAVRAHVSALVSVTADVLLAGAVVFMVARALGSDHGLYVMLVVIPSSHSLASLTLSFSFKIPDQLPPIQTCHCG